MKICTDACIFGSYIEVLESKSILDIGTGTGLLSLMVAQRTDDNAKPPHITAVEIEENAFLSAKKNFEESSYKERLTALHYSIQDFSAVYFSKYDHIISNPPFFLHQQKTKNTSKNLALHSEALSFDELLTAIKKLLSEDGKCDILLPAFEMDIFTKKAENHKLFPQKILKVFNRRENQEKNEVFRTITRFQNIENKSPKQDNLIIYKSKGDADISLNRGYTDDFVVLLKDFYIIF